MANDAALELREFLEPKLESGFLDKYIVRSAILSALRETLPMLSGKLLDVGAGRQPYRSVVTGDGSRVEKYCPLDIEGSPIYPGAEFKWDGVKMPFGDAEFDCAIATEVLEHCPEPRVTLDEISRVLKPCGVLFITVPFIWPLHDCPYDEFRYTPFALTRLLTESGFKQIRLWPTGGWDASLAQVLGLWLHRRPMKPSHRYVLSALLLPAFRWLARRDRPSKAFNNDCYLMPGIAGTAIREVKSP